MLQLVVLDDSVVTMNYIIERKFANLENVVTFNYK